MADLDNDYLLEKQYHFVQMYAKWQQVDNQEYVNMLR